MKYAPARIFNHLFIYVPRMMAAGERIKEANIENALFLREMIFISIIGRLWLSESHSSR